LSHFSWLIPSDYPFKNIFYVLNTYGVVIYIAHHLERMTNNMGQTMSAGCDFLSQLEQRE